MYSVYSFLLSRKHKKAQKTFLFSIFSFKFPFTEIYNPCSFLLQCHVNVLCFWCGWERRTNSVEFFKYPSSFFWPNGKINWKHGIKMVCLPELHMQIEAITYATRIKTTLVWCFCVLSTIRRFNLYTWWHSIEMWCARLLLCDWKLSTISLRWQECVFNRLLWEVVNIL